MWKIYVFLNEKGENKRAYTRDTWKRNGQNKKRKRTKDKQTIKLQEDCNSINKSKERHRTWPRLKSPPKTAKLLKTLLFLSSQIFNKTPKKVAHERVNHISESTSLILDPTQTTMSQLLNYTPNISKMLLPIAPSDRRSLKNVALVRP